MLPNDDKAYYLQFQHVASGESTVCVLGIVALAFVLRRLRSESQVLGLGVQGLAVVDLGSLGSVGSTLNDHNLPTFM